MRRAARRFAPTALTLAAVLSLAGCASSSTGSPQGSRSGQIPGHIAGAAVLSLEVESSGGATETLTVLDLPLPGLGAPADAVASWTQLEASSVAGWSPAPIGIDPAGRFAILAEDDGVRLVSLEGTPRTISRLSTQGAVRSVSLAADGTAAALSKDGTTLQMLRAGEEGLALTAEFPLDIALGSGAQAAAALVSPSGQAVAVLDTGRSAVTIMEITPGTGGAVGLVRASEHRVGRGASSGVWTPSGDALLVTETMWEKGDLDGLDVHAVSGRVSVIRTDGNVSRTAVPGMPRDAALSPAGDRAAVLLDTAAGPALALLSIEGPEARLLDTRPAASPAAGVAFDASGQTVLVAHPAMGALAVWAADGASLHDTGMLVETGPGVTAVAVVPN